MVVAHLGSIAVLPQSQEKHDGQGREGVECVERAYSPVERCFNEQVKQFKLLVMLREMQRAPC